MGDYQPGNGKDIAVGEFAPDMDSTTPGIILDAIGAYPSSAGYRPLPQTAVIGAALDGLPLGSFLAYYSDETTRLFAATTTGIYYLNGAVWTVSLSITLSGVVNFTQFGDDVLMVANLAGGVYIAAAKGTTFAAIVTSPANATTIISVSAQALAFAGANWYSSASGNDALWTPNVATLSATGVLYDAPGPVVGASALYRTALAFKKNSIFLGTQSGPPFSWSWDVISGETGTWGQGCIIEMTDSVAFVGLDDFWITSGYAPQRIQNSVKSWFFDNADPNYMASIQGWYDASQAILYWHFVSTIAPITGVCDMFVSYNVRAKRWCNGHLSLSSVPYFSRAATQIPLPTSAHKPIFIDGAKVPRQFSGSAGPMSILSGYYGLSARKTQLMRLRPKYTTYPASETLAIFHLETLGKGDQSTENPVLGTDGWWNMGQTDRYHRWMVQTKGVTELVGWTPELRIAGVN